MDFLQQDVRNKLIKENLEFRKLIEEHKIADERLLHLSGISHLSPKEEIEETELKKVKLRAKERIYKIVEAFLNKK